MDDGDTTMDREVFQHPEGLLTARNLVRIIISGLSTSRTMSDSLQQVLTFNDSDIQPVSALRPPRHLSSTPPPNSTHMSSLLASHPHRSARLCQQQVAMKPARKPTTKKRKSEAEDEPEKKKPKRENAAKPRIPKPKEKKVLVCITLSHIRQRFNIPFKDFIVLRRY